MLEPQKLDVYQRALDLLETAAIIDILERRASVDATLLREARGYLTSVISMLTRLAQIGQGQGQGQGQG